LKKNKKEDISKIKEGIKEAREYNEKIRENNRNKIVLENIKETEKQRKLSDEKVKEIENKKLELIKSCKLPE
jgi:hypothetical protein